MRLGLSIALACLQMASGSLAFSHDPVDTTMESSSNTAPVSAPTKTFTSLTCGPDSQGRSAEVLMTENGYAFSVWLYHPGQPPVQLEAWTYDVVENRVSIRSFRGYCRAG